MFPIKILIVYHSNILPPKPGADKHIFDTAISLSKYHEVTVLTFGCGENYEKMFDNIKIKHYSTRAKIKYEQIQAKKGIKIIVDIVTFLGFYYIIFLRNKGPSIKTFRTDFSEKYDLVIRIAFDGNKIPKYLHKKHNIPVIELPLVSGLPHYIANLKQWLKFIHDNTILSSSFFRAFYMLSNVVVQRLYVSSLSSKNLIAVSYSDFNQFLKFKNLNPRFIFPILTFHPPLTPFKVHNDTVLFFSGNSFAVRIASKFIRVAASMLPNTKFIITGFKPTNQDKITLNNIKYLGFVNDEEFTKTLESSSIVILPLISASGIQTKMALSLAYGKPIITTSVIAAEFPNIVNGKQVIIEDDPEKFIEKINFLMSNPIIRDSLSEEASNYYKQYLGYDKIVKMHLDYIKEVISNDN